MLFLYPENEFSIKYLNFTYTIYKFKLINTMENKEFFFKDAEIISKDLENKIEKAELQKEKKKKEMEDAILKLKEKKMNFDADLEKLKTLPDDQLEAEAEGFKKKYSTESIMDELDEKFGEFAEKTKSFFSDLGTKVSDFYHKQMDKKDKPEDIK